MNEQASDFVPIRNATRKTAGPNTMANSRRAFPPHFYAPQRTPIPKGGPPNRNGRVAEPVEGAGMFAGAGIPTAAMAINFFPIVSYIHLRSSGT